MSMSAPQAPMLPPLPAAPPPPPAFGMVQGQKKQQKSPTATFLGAGDIANAPTMSGMTSGQFGGGKTLLGT